MLRYPVVIPLDVSFETAVSALSADKGFVAIDSRGAVRTSIVASNPSHSLAFSGGFVTIDGHTVIDSPSDALRRFMAYASVLLCDSYLPFCGGGIGYIGFEGARALGGFEPARGFSRYPQCSFGIHSTVALFNHVEGTASIVSSDPDSKAASRDAEVLKERLESSLRWKAGPIAASNEDISGLRILPSDGDFKRRVDAAFTWLRSESLERIHLVRHLSRPAGDVDPVETFIAGSGAGCSHALFSHEGAYAIVSSGDVVCANSTEMHPSAIVDELVGVLPSNSFTGTPVNRAVSFIDANEDEPRAFYGGTLGIFDSRRLRFSAITEARTFADGVVGFTAGADMTPDQHPAQFTENLLSRFQI